MPRVFQIIGIAMFSVLIIGGIVFYFIFLKPAPSPVPINEQKTITLSVYFGHKNISLNDCSQTLAVKRVIPYTTGVARSALEQLFSGPTEQEKQAGYSSIWGNDSSILKSIYIEDGTMYIDLKDIRATLSSISSSCGSAAAFAQLNATLTQFSAIHDTRVAINGNPETFYEWVQIGCAAENDYCNPAPFLFASKNSDPWTVYTDPRKLFSVSYPKLFSKKETKITLYPLKALYPAIQFDYTIPVQYCALSGNCSPQTKNMSIQIAPLPLSYQEARDLLTKDLSPEPFTAAGQKGFVISMGAEGEGIYYYVFPFGNSRALVITRSYMDESILIGYRTAPAFIPFEDQKKLFEEIIGTLSINE